MAIDIGPKIGIDGEAEFRKQITNITNQVKTFGSELKVISSSADGQAKSMESLAKKSEVLTSAIAAQSKKVEELKKGLAESAAKYGENDTKTLKWKQAVNNATAELNGLKSELDDTNNALKNNGKQLDDSSGKFEKFKSVLGTAGKAIAAGVAAAAAAVGATIGQINNCIDVYAGFEDSMAQVAATMGITAEEIANGSEAYEMLADTAKEMGSATRFSASESAEALNYLALAGYDAGKACETLPKVLNLAAAGGMDLATTSDLVTDAMSAMSMDTSELDTFVDQLAKTSQKSNTSVQQLGEAILVCAGTATSTGQELDSVNTALGILADNGIKGAEGGTNLRNVLLSLSSPTDKAASQLKNLGVSVYDAEGNMRQIDEVFADMASALDELSQEDRTNALSNIFNKTDLNAVNALLGSTNGRFAELNGLIVDSTGAAAAMAETMESGLAGSARSFESAMEGLQITVGEIFAGMKQDVMSSTTGIISELTAALDAADGDFEQIGAAIGQALESMIGLIAESLPEFVDMAMQIVASIAKGIVDNLPQITETALELITTLVNGIISALPQVAVTAIQMITTLVDGIADALPQLIPASVDIIGQIVQTLIENFPQIVMSGVNLIAKLIEGLISAIPNLVSQVVQIGKKAADAFKSLDWGTIGRNIMQGIANGIANGASAIVNAAKNAATRALNAAKNFLGIHSPSTVFRDEIGKNMMLGMANGLNRYAGLAADAAKTAAGDVSGAFESNVYVPKYSNGTAAAYNNLAASLGNLTVVLSDGTLVGKISPKIDTTLGGYTKRKGRYGV